MSKRLIAKNTLLREVKRTKRGGSAKFTFPLTAKITKSLEWPDLPEGTKGWSPEDSELNATMIQLTPNNDELKAAATTVDVQHMGDFQIIRKAKQKGKDSVKAVEKITEVMCTVSFADPDGCAKLEKYMLSAARSEMLVIYTPQATQEELPGTRVDMTPDDSQLPLQTEERAEVVAQMEPGEGESAEVKRGRGRPRKEQVQ